MNIDKLLKLLPDGIYEDYQSKTVDELRNEIARCEANIREVEDARDADAELKAQADKLKEMKGPYTDGIKAQRARQRLAAVVIQDRGKEA